MTHQGTRGPRLARFDALCPACGCAVFTFAADRIRRCCHCGLLYVTRPAKG